MRPVQQPGDTFASQAVGVDSTEQLNELFGEQEENMLVARGIEDGLECRAGLEEDVQQLLVGVAGHSNQLWFNMLAIIVRRGLLDKEIRQLPSMFIAHHLEVECENYNLALAGSFDDTPAYVSSFRFVECTVIGRISKPGWDHKFGADLRSV